MEKIVVNKNNEKTIVVDNNEDFNVVIKNINNDFYYNNIKLKLSKQKKDKEGNDTFVVNLDKIYKLLNVDKNKYSPLFVSTKKLNNEINNIILKYTPNKNIKSNKNINDNIKSNYTEEEKKQVEEYEEKITYYSDLITNINNRVRERITKERLNNTINNITTNMNKEELIKFFEEQLKKIKG